MGDFIIFCRLVKSIIWSSLDNSRDNSKQLITTSSFLNLTISFF